MAEIAVIVLAAGRASRFGAELGDSKVLADIDGEPMVRRVVVTALASQAAPVLVVTGNAEKRVVAALAGLSVVLVPNPNWASGMAGSLAAGLGAVPSSAAGALICLADMPFVRAATLDHLIETFDDAAEAVVPVHDGTQGNPVLIGRALFTELAAGHGDEGARKLLARGDRRVILCSVDDPGVAIDVDTREALASLHPSAPMGGGRP